MNKKKMLIIAAAVSAALLLPQAQRPRMDSCSDPIRLSAFHAYCAAVYLDCREYLNNGVSLDFSLDSGYNREKDGRAQYGR